jgi:hypothetical protein
MADVLTPGGQARVHAGPGYPTDLVVTILSVDGRTATAASTYGVATFTLRKNGKWATKGDAQWSNYLRPL